MAAAPWTMSLCAGQGSTLFRHSLPPIHCLLLHHTPHHTAAMRSPSRLLLLAALVAGAAAFDLLDPSEVVDKLSHSAGLEKWKKPDFCGCAGLRGRWRWRDGAVARRCAGHDISPPVHCRHSWPAGAQAQWCAVHACMFQHGLPAMSLAALAAPPLPAGRATALPSR